MTDPLTLMAAGTAALGAAGVCAYGGAKAWKKCRSHGLDRWTPEYFFPSESRPKTDLNAGPLDVFIAVCDHYEPEWGSPSEAIAVDRVKQWVNDYPRLFREFRDVDGRPPQHTFFYPQDQYRPVYLDLVATLCRQGFGDVDVHLHHDDDTPQGLTDKLAGFRDDLFHRHGLLRRDPRTGNVAYGFIHGNWALCNSRPDGRWCGVDHEIPILLETGCYADFTMPSVPSDTQTRTINSIYYAKDVPGQRKSHEFGIRARAGQLPPANSLLMIQGPLGFDWKRRKFGLIPRIENGDLLASHPPMVRRVSQWLNAAVTVAGKPNWRFVKLHTHGCKPDNLAMWLSPTVQQFHRDLAELARSQPNFRYHYVTAWEMALLVRQAEMNSQVAGSPLASLPETSLNSPNSVVVPRVNPLVRA